jgi:hypothetical protein
MNSPAGGAGGPSYLPFIPSLAEAITTELLAAIKEMEEATPEPENRWADFEESYDGYCKLLRKRFEPRLVDTWRKKIAYPEYWAAECKQYQDALHELLQQRAQAAHSDNGAAAARALAMSYQRILRRNGVSSAQMSKIRDSIKDQQYWNLETQVLEYQASIRTEKAEARIILQLDQEGRWPWPLPSPCREMRLDQLRRAGPKGPRRANPNPPTEGGIASRTRSKTAATSQRGVAKRVSRGRR